MATLHPGFRRGYFTVAAGPVASPPPEAHAASSNAAAAPAAIAARRTTAARAVMNRCGGMTMGERTHSRARRPRQAQSLVRARRRAPARPLPAQLGLERGRQLVGHDRVLGDVRVVLARKLVRGLRDDLIEEFDLPVAGGDAL